MTQVLDTDCNYKENMTDIYASLLNK
jgi:hypothetical protein